MRAVGAILRWLVSLLIAIGARRGRAEAREEQAAAASQAAQEARVAAAQVEEQANASVAAYRRDGASRRLRDGTF